MKKFIIKLLGLENLGKVLADLKRENAEMKAECEAMMTKFNSQAEAVTLISDAQEECESRIKDCESGIEDCESGIEDCVKTDYLSDEIETVLGDKEYAQMSDIEEKIEEAISEIKKEPPAVKEGDMEALEKIVNAVVRNFLLNRVTVDMSVKS